VCFILFSGVLGWFEVFCCVLGCFGVFWGVLLCYEIFSCVFRCFVVLLFVLLCFVVFIVLWGVLRLLCCGVLLADSGCF